MKRILALLLALAMVFALGACGSKTESSAAGSAVGAGSDVSSASNAGSAESVLRGAGLPDTAVFDYYSLR